MEQDEVAVRSHDILVSSGTARASEFETLTTIGAAVRLALNLRGMPPVEYGLLREVAVHRLGLQPGEVRPALELLAEAEMVDLAGDNSTTKTILPNIPYFEDLYRKVGEAGASTQGLNEHEQLTLAVMHRLGQGPTSRNELTKLGAEDRALNRILQIGSDAGFVLPKRARGHDIYISPAYFAEDPQALADLAALAGSSRLGRILSLIKKNQGYPLSIIEERRDLGGTNLDDKDILLIKALAGEGFVPPPSVRTSHSGENHFMFGPRPGNTRLAPHEGQIFNNALALAAAVRQGQFLAREYKINYPAALVRALLRDGHLGSNSEAIEQYRIVAQHGIGRLVPTTGDRARLELIQTPDNIRAAKLAVDLLAGPTDKPTPDEELVLAMRKGEEYVEPLLARKSLSECKIVNADEEAKHAVDDFLLRRGCA
ncbi:hypothetical protein KRR26_28540 [Corallococcus sp. M34]|uniref:hypothetical protein n=1 Tax=Citreicoccus inhibens TaxID=2849499 RepID=UPI001C2492F7|nr:hypothetical protein [Citreicoccus inhibens]MBU8899565.1 hypothetical protein [Citreicoccus inhibens]